MADRQRRVMLILLMISLLVSHLDRHLLSIALPQIQAEFALTDSQLGLLSGLPFAVVFVACALITSRFVRPGRNKSIVVAALVIWSLATLFIGLATGIFMLVALRMLVGGGEAMAIPTSHAMIIRAFPPRAPRLGFGGVSVWDRAGTILRLLAWRHCHSAIRLARGVHLGRCRRVDPGADHVGLAHRGTLGHATRNGHHTTPRRNSLWHPCSAVIREPHQPAFACWVHSGQPRHLWRGQLVSVLYGAGARHGVGIDRALSGRRGGADRRAGRLAGWALCRTC